MLPFPNGEHFVLSSLCLVHPKLFLTNLAINGGLSEIDLVTGQHSKMFHSGTFSTPAWPGRYGLYDLLPFVNCHTATSQESTQYFLLPFSSRELDVNVYAGNGDSVRQNGLVNKTLFGQPSSTVAEGNSLLVCDKSVNAITRLLLTLEISSMSPFLKRGQPYQYIYIHEGIFYLVFLQLYSLTWVCKTSF